MPTEAPLTPPGRGVCIAVIDSGVHASHPHVRGVASGVAIDAQGRVSSDYVDRLGHGTAVMAAIDLAVETRVHIINLSLGTANLSHTEAFKAATARATAAGIAIVAARDDGGVTWLPGVLPGVVGVQVDWQCPRHEFRTAMAGGGIVYRASGFARPVPGVDPLRNLRGVSFAVANMTGLLARAMSLLPPSARSAHVALERLGRFAELRGTLPGVA